MSPLSTRLSLAAAAVARGAILALFAIFCLLIGLGCLTAAAWIAIAAEMGHLMAALVIGGVWMLLGALFLIALTRRPRPVAPPVAEPEALGPPAPVAGGTAAAIAMAFAQGLGAGLSTRRRL
ncbi:hypothetical protein [Pseudoroseicyclus tamaricis]|uniref:Uncharacterized protein n=1 Tax=Pseudoroseicyclus tamaricis TaxID=2705421 RepID=A0A6B2JYS7_9RHOB|nr:hypothetical protein [Pseudoroseicyclus tamaricis]NDV01454.1 hypothetical protein [Pseudoroseicyclus tamaricis]